MSDKVLLPFEATEAMADAVKNIVSAYAAKKIWEQMAMAALFDAEAAPVQPTDAAVTHKEPNAQTSAAPPLAESTRPLPE